MPSSLSLLRHAVIILPALLTSVQSLPAGPANGLGLGPELPNLVPALSPVSSLSSSSSSSSTTAKATSTLSSSTTPAAPSTTPPEAPGRGNTTAPAGVHPAAKSPPSPVPLLVGPGASNASCGNISQYFGQTPADWEAANTDAWLDRWWNSNSPSFKYQTGGFASVFGQQYLGNPDWTCSMDGSTSNCDFNPCMDSRILEMAGTSEQPAYYVIESVNRFHSYFTGLSQSLQVSGIFSSLSSGAWVSTFWMSPKQGSAVMERIAAIVLITLVAVASAALTFVAPIAAAGLAATASMFYGAYALAMTTVSTPNVAAQEFAAASEVGQEIASTFLSGMKEIITGNDQLMEGNSYGGHGDMRAFIKNGTFVNFSGVNQTLAIDWMNAMLMSKAINQLWRKQKVFIMGGGNCNDTSGIGSGPPNGKLCRDGKAWYLYFWKEQSGISLTSHQWGWVDLPPGAGSLGNGEYQGVTIDDVINSSLDAYNYAGYNYTDQMAHDRAADALAQGWANPGALGPAWEGIWDIPVCDVGWAGNSKLEGKQFILMNYGSNSRPHWCGPICSNDTTKTQNFINAANMKNFESPTVYC